MKIFQIGAFSWLASDWFQTGLRLALRISDFVFRFQIASDCFQIHFRLVWKIVKTSDFVFTFQIDSYWPETQHRRRTLSLPQPLRRRRIYVGPTWDDGWKLQLPTWKYGWRLRRRRTKFSNKGWRRPPKKPKSKPPLPNPPIPYLLPGPHPALLPYILPRPCSRGILFLLVPL